MGYDISGSFEVQATLVANEFIDNYMVNASGEYVKVYLYLLRHKHEQITIEAIADSLNHTEADVKRALAYWQRIGAVRTDAQGEGAATQRQVAQGGQNSYAQRQSVQGGQGGTTSYAQQSAARETSGQSGRQTYSADQIVKLSQDDDFSQLLYIAQKYMNKAFTPRDSEVLAYLYDGLHMSVELLEYVVEYCVQGGHNSMRYIETVALSWHEKGLTTVDMAQSYAATFTKNSFAVMRAFGLTDRKPATTEMECMERWFRNYGFALELVLEACNRTMEACHTPSFKYADKILSEWFKAGVKNMADVQKLDQKRQASHAQAVSKAVQPAARKNNQFHNFQQRDTDYDAIILQQLP